MAALRKDLYIEQGADWPGEAFSIVDSLGNPKTLDNLTMIATGSIAGPRGKGEVFTWSNAGTDPAQGLVLMQGPLFIPTVTADQTLDWTFTNALYQLYLFDPAGPPGDQEIRVGEGTVYLSRKIR